MQMSDEKLTAVNASVGVGGFTLYSFTLNEWVAIITIAYLALQIGLLLPKYYRAIRDWLNKPSKRCKR